MDKTTKADQKGYAFIRNQIMHNGVTPSLREIAKAVGYSSPRSAQLMLKRLQDRNLLSYSKGAICLNPFEQPAMERTISVPLIGAVACGLPMLAEEDVEAMIDISTKIAKPGYNYFLLRAVGDSMNKSGINDGDFVLIRRQSTADDGERVAALINDDATIKHFYRENDAVVLKPNSKNTDHKPIILSEDFQIQGVVVATLPKEIY